jgi:hypothetical protein
MLSSIGVLAVSTKRVVMRLSRPLLRGHMPRLSDASQFVVEMARRFSPIRSLGGALSPARLPELTGSLAYALCPRRSHHVLLRRFLRSSRMSRARHITRPGRLMRRADRTAHPSPVTASPEAGKRTGYYSEQAMPWEPRDFGVQGDFGSCAAH